MSDSNLKRWQRIVLSKPMEYLLPTASTLYYNHRHLSGELATTELPAQSWAQQEAKDLLTRSDERLRSLEAKGPGLATVAAVVTAGVVAAIIEGGDDATVLGKVVLGIATWYAIWSLLVPIYLVGPQKRHTIDVGDLHVAKTKSDPEQYLAIRAQAAAQGNVRRALRVANLQDAARKELIAALILLTVWLVLGVAAGLLKADASPGRARTQSVTTAATTTSSRTPPGGSSDTRTIAAADVAQIASAVFTALAALAALLTVRQARDETRISRAALDADTQPLITDVPRGLFIDEVEWHNADGSVSLKRQDRFELSVGTAGPEPVSGATVPVRNVGNGPARITDVSFITPEGDAATGWVANPVLPPAEMTTVGLWAAADDPGVAVGASIGEAYEDFAVLIAYADATGRPRGAVLLQIANGQHPRITGRRWAQRASELRA